MKRFTMLYGLGILLFASLTLAFNPSRAFGAVPRLIGFEGILKDGFGNPVADGSYSVAFKIYDGPGGGAAVRWMETQSVTTLGGLFNVLLGSATPLPDTTFNDSTRYLGITVAADPEMTPRVRLASVGYSFTSDQWNSVDSNLFRVKGYVGIGTATPFGKLHLRDDIDGAVELRIENQNTGIQSAEGIQFNSEDGSGTTSGAGIKVFDNSNSSNSAHLAFFNNRPSGVMRFTVNGQTRLFIENDGDVGVGTSAPEARLHVFNGSAGNVGLGNLPVAVFENSTDNFISLVAPDISQKGILFGGPSNINDAGIIYSGYQLYFYANAGSTQILLDSNGNVGIGTTVPATKLQVRGDIRVGTGGPSGADGCVQQSDGVSIAGTCVSDSRLKKDVQPFSPLLDKMARLEPVTFNWRTDEYPDLNLPKVEDQGLIAQEVEKFLPELVTENEKGFKAIHYHQLPLMTLQAVKELKAANDQLKARLQRLEELVEKLVVEKKEGDKKLGQLR